MNKENKNYLYSILGTPKQLLGKHVGKEEYEILNQLVEKHERVKRDMPQPPKSPLKVGAGWKKIWKVR